MGHELKLSKGRAGRTRANLAIHCDRVSVLDEFVFERAGDVVQLPIPLILFAIQVSDVQYA